METTHIAFFAKQRHPLEFNTLIIREDGSIEEHRPGRTVRFRFAYGEIPFAARTRSVEDRPVLDLEGEVGPLPYSAESVPLRRAAHAIMRASWALPHGRLVAWPSARIRAIGRMPLPRPLTPVGILAAVTTMVLELKPFLELLDEALAATPEPAENAATAAPR